ncbi:hypothetical protein M9H77_30840 [Catharanthus roseus]|uniref:Uncharacterized protein n=1 Tax=Catharanthus roseus TaxID=4058 RepID=A0ACB9ZYD2_CATRO|nr:hypothetical protein M9H77_30840 [Catharanthus roseus]
MSELGSYSLVLGIRTLSVEPTVALHISSGRSGAHQTTEVLGQEFESSVKFSFMLSCKVVDMAHPSHRWTYREGTLIDEPSRTTSSSSSSYSLREIVSEGEPILVIDFSEDKSVEGPEMAPGIRLGTSIDEDPSEPMSDSEMTPEPERVAPTAVGDMDTFVADSLPVAASPTPIPPVELYLLFQHYHHYFGRVEAPGQQIVELREEISRVHALFYTAR